MEIPIMNKKFTKTISTMVAALALLSVGVSSTNVCRWCN